MSTAHLRIAVLILPGWGVACEPGNRADNPSAEPACVVSAIGDGDTLSCADGRRVRIVLIDAPELEQAPYGTRSHDALRALAPVGTPLAVEYDVERVDPYGRHLAYLYLPDGRMVNEEMVGSGYAVVLIIRPNGKHETRMRAALRRAEAAGRGLWADWKFACMPRDFRAGRCAGR